jgi:hypothetical protein
MTTTAAPIPAIVSSNEPRARPATTVTAARTARVSVRFYIVSYLRVTIV